MDLVGGDGLLEPAFLEFPLLSSLPGKAVGPVEVCHNLRESQAWSLYVVYVVVNGLVHRLLHGRLGGRLLDRMVHFLAVLFLAVLFHVRVFVHRVMLGCRILLGSVEVLVRVGGGKGGCFHHHCGGHGKRGVKFGD
mmetsp:Transcript_60215/g.141811  ORF Transcript_60215/g.141811 Transcript_60215/m.141811 type:complete len:136 (+) Transcript_60215:115-522(+)